jgi:NitT/TauT family transport system substrate-binding protein
MPTQGRARACLLVLLVLLAGCARNPPPPAPAGRGLFKVRFLTDWYPQAEHGGFYQALAKGFYRDEGLDVDIIAGGPGVSVAQKMVGGLGDIGMSASDWVIIDVNRGLPFLMVGATMQHDPQAILVHKDSPVRSLRDLDGRTIMGEPGANWIDYLTARYGIHFSLIPMNYGLAQFVADKDFIQQCFITNEPFYLRQKGVEFRTLLIADSGYDPYRVIFTNQRFAAEHPEAVRGFVAASIRGWEDFIHGDASPAKKMIAGRNDQMSPAFMDFTIKTLRENRIIDGRPEAGERTGQLTRRRLQEQIDLLARLKIIPAPLRLEQVADLGFLPPGTAAP